MLPHHQDPIVAIATAPGRGAVGIVRASGRDVAPLIQALCGRPLLPRQATYTALFDKDRQVIDRGLAIHFPAPHSYTGEDVVEFQAHGGPVVMQLLLARCLEAGAAHGLRIANAGEFTERAFLNGKLDLAQAEAVADLIDAGTEAAARSASRSLSGVFSDQVNVLGGRLIQLRTLVEATLDFPEEDIDFLKKADARGQLQDIAASIEALQGVARQGALLREGMTVVLAGQPNVGKSSLLNALAGAERAIVTPVAGTTRDKVTATIQIEGVPLHIVDTAGLRESTDEVERIGIARTWDEIAAADAVVFLHDLTRAGEPAFNAGDAEIFQRLPASVRGSGRLLHVFTKADAVSNAVATNDQHTELPDRDEESALARSTLIISAITGQGLDGLRAELLRLAGWHALPEGVFTARARHLHALKECRAHLRMAGEELDQPGPALDLLAEELWLAHRSLSSITGEYSPDDLLGEIFGHFCIGK